MKKRNIVFIFLVGLALNLVSAPRLRFEQGNTVDWGKIHKTENPLSAKVRIFNDGDDTLKILSVKPGCGCTTAPLDKKEIEPKGFATLDITLHLPNHPGQITKSIAIYTNDSSNLETFLFLKAEIVPPLKFFPDTKILASNLLVGDTSLYKLIIQNLTETDITIKEPKAEPEDEISSNLHPDIVLKPKEQYTIEIKIAPSNVGNFNGKIKFKTTYPDLPRVEIPVFGVVSGFKK